MKILIYCQHVLGIGHLFRILEIARAMKEHRVCLVLGGPPVSISLPRHVRVIQLPGLRMDADFSELSPVDPGRSLEQIKAERKAVLHNLARELKPDIIIIELFPFGRNGFSFELLPLLKDVRSGELPSARVVCSLRDILVEKKDQASFEQRVLDRLNSLFDALLVHGDPDVIGLDATFSRVGDITIPVVYTGYICEKSSCREGAALKEQIRLHPDEKLIVVSAGGGNVGYHLLDTALRASELLHFPVRMQIFTGPYLEADHFADLRQKITPGIRIERFTDNFPSWLAAADLSISMGGYNTSVNVLASGTPALIHPFAQNREQRLRAERFAAMAAIRLLPETDISPGVLADHISSMIERKKTIPAVRLDGAEKTNQLLTRWLATGVIP
ncbi:MAG TPA: glycosyl transferase [Desulfobacteraceae bacterium]|nr:glycosyl transferase [Desulfobacteraceae bacterium]